MTETSNQVPDDKVTIEIDGQTVLADKGSMIIHATDAHGINVPRFCYHKNYRSRPIAVCVWWMWKKHPKPRGMFSIFISWTMVSFLGSGKEE
jgi:NADH dehydrogenase subunit G (EC 1.6.5.3)